MEEKYFSLYASPVGVLRIASDGQYITSIHFDGFLTNQISQEIDLIEECKKQLEEYFQGLRKNFELPLKPVGTDFQQKVWNELIKIPFGDTSTYNLIAKKLGSEKLNRAVGLANGANPLPIIIPCHRIIGSNGKLTGYAGGLNRKRWLLSHEFQFSDKAKKNLLF